MTKEDYMKLSKERLAELLAERDTNIRIVPMNIPSWRPSCYEHWFKSIKERIVK